jgi:hypothetical protein
MTWQLDLFDSADPLLGIEVHLPCQCQCGHDVLRLGSGQGRHRASLKLHRMWSLSAGGCRTKSRILLPP